jgi:DNA-binding NtrC family response regulator
VRLVAATNRNLEHEVERGHFRQDLFFRLWKFPIRVPALRERREDIPVLARTFLQRYNRELSKNIVGFTDEALRFLGGYSWPGNVRELENVVERAAILQDGDRIQARNLLLGNERLNDSGGSDLLEGDWQEAKKRFERAYIRKTIAAARGNISHAARLAGMDRGNFRDKMNAYGISPEDGTTVESRR